jgi:metallo-beta-lactamase class B
MKLPAPALLLAGLLVADPAAAQLNIRISVPADTPPGATIYVAGTFNGWNPDSPGYELTPANGGLFTIILPEEIRGAVEFKFTLGSWDSVETDSSGADVPNRSFTAPAEGEVFYSGTVEAWRDGKREVESTAGPGVSVLDAEFEIPQLGRTRRVWLYLPPDYTTSNRSYPVLYMHDGQNVFDEATSFAGEWGVDEALDRLHEEGDAGAIVVAVDNGGEHRLDEYSPYIHPSYGGGEGDAYLDFIVHSLKPLVDAKYRTLSDRLHTGIMGSSMGGLISLYAILKHPDVFGRAGVFSPALWIAPDIFEMARSAQPLRPDPRIYIVSGALEGQAGEDEAVYMRGQRRMVDTLEAAGFRIGTEVESLIQPDGRHAEWFWRREFPAAYQWLFTHEAHD